MILSVHICFAFGIHFGLILKGLALFIPPFLLGLVRYYAEKKRKRVRFADEEEEIGGMSHSAI